MVSFYSSLLACLLASTSAAFAVKPVTQSMAFTHRPSSSTQRTPVNLSMSGGASVVPDLKVGSLFLARSVFESEWIYVATNLFICDFSY